MKWTRVLICLGLAAGLIVIFTRRPDTPPPPKAAIAPPQSSFGPISRAKNANLQTAPMAADATNTSPRNALSRWLNEEEVPKLTREQIESYLAENNRSAESLLAAFRVSGDKEFLKEAGEKFPNDPRVAFAAAFRSDSPEERRAWVEALKQSAPGNALPNYLSALDHLKSGQSAEAVAELAAASSKNEFRDYSMDFLQGAQEAYLSAGYPEAEAKAIASISLLLPHFAELKRLGVGMTELAGTYQQGGDAASAQAILQMTMKLGQQLESPSGWGTTLGSWVGIAIERIALGAMDPAAPLGDSGGTVQARLDELGRQRASSGALNERGSRLLETMSDQDLNNYFDRAKLFGDEAALRWAISKAEQAGAQ